MISTHTAYLKLTKVNAVGQVIPQGEPISAHLNFSTEHRIIPDSALPNTANNPTIEQYLALEAADDYEVKQLDQTFVITVKKVNPRGSFYIVTDAATNIPNAGDWVKMAGDTALGPVFQFDDAGIDNRLRYTGAVTRQFRIHAQVTSHSDAPNINLFIRICKNSNGDSGIPSEQHRKMGAADDEGNIGAEWIFELATNNYVEIHFSTDNAGSPNFFGHAVTMTATVAD